MNELESNRKSQDNDVLTCRQAIFIVVLGVAAALSVGLLGSKMLGAPKPNTLVEEQIGAGPESTKDQPGTHIVDQ